MEQIQDPKAGNQNCKGFWILYLFHILFQLLFLKFLKKNRLDQRCETWPMVQIWLSKPFHLAHGQSSGLLEVGEFGVPKPQWTWPLAVEVNKACADTASACWAATCFWSHGASCSPTGTATCYSPAVLAANLLGRLLTLLLMLLLLAPLPMVLPTPLPMLLLNVQLTLLPASRPGPRPTAAPQIWPSLNVD